MRRWREQPWLRLAVPAVVPLAVFAVLRTAPRLDFLYQDARFHLIFVSAIAACALAVAVAAARAGSRADHFGPVWLAAGCLAVGFLMLAHGLTTPGQLGHGFNQWVGRLAYLAITVFAFALAMACRPRNARSSRLATHHPKALLLATTAVVGGLAVVVVQDPSRLHGSAPLPYEDGAKLTMTIAAALTFTVVGRVHWRRWLLGHDPVQYALMLACAMSTAALLSLRFGEMWRLSWWDYHGWLLAGFGGAAYAIWARYRRTMAVSDVLADTFETDPMTHIAHGYPDALKTLVRAVEVKDTYTHGHSERTAKVAVQLGLRLGLDENQLRALARGAYLHDVGKITVPDDILNKPGRLTPDERSVIETHTTVGYELVAPVQELAEALPVVLHHHERWDGGGYPRGLRGQDIPLIARVAAVADVWDALTSDRAYRPGMAPQVALAHIVAGRSSHFDASVVDALVHLAADWGYHLGRSPEGSDEVSVAAETCHEVTSNRA